MSLSATIKIIDENDSQIELVELENIENPTSLSYTLNETFIQIDLFDNGALIINEAKDHKTKLNLNNESHLEIASEEGTLEIPVKLLAYEKKDDIVCMRYMLEEIQREIIIEYGVK